MALLAVLAILLAYVYGGRVGYDLAWIEKDQEDDLIPEVHDCKQTISQGARGPEVQAFQAWYNQNRDYGVRKLAEDGVFGEQTRNAADSLSLPISFRLDQIAKNICS